MLTRRSTDRKKRIKLEGTQWRIEKRQLGQTGKSENQTLTQRLSAIAVAVEGCWMAEGNWNILKKDI